MLQICKNTADTCEDALSLEDSIRQIATDHTGALILFLSIVFILAITIIALYIAYKWGKQIQKHLDAEKLKYQNNFFFLKSILNTIPDEIYRIDSQGAIIPIMELESNISKISTDYLETTIYKIWHSDFSSKIAIAINEVLSTKSTVSFDFSHIENGSIKCHSIQMVPFGEKEVLTTIRNITEQYYNKSKQEESEFLFQTQFDYGLNGIGILDENLEWTSVNKRLAEILGYTREEMISMKWHQVIIPEDSDYDAYLFSKNKEKIGIILNAEKRFLSKEGDIIYAFCTIIQYFNETKNAHSFIVTVQDISFRKEHERTLLDAIIKTEEKERTNFAQEIHDGVGPILSSIKMYIQWLQRPDIKTDKEQILKDCELLIDDAHRAVREVSFNLSPHVLKNFGLIASLQSFTARIKEASKIKVNFKIDNDKVRFPESVEVVLYRAVTECINNTIKYANANNIDITINSSDKNMELFYCDDGIGFDASKALASGKGTGLYNIQNRIKSINGECHFLGKVGSGTKILFIVNL